MVQSFLRSKANRSINRSDDLWQDMGKNEQVGILVANSFHDPCSGNIILSGQASAECTKAQSGWILAATILASSMAFIDGTVVNVAIPFLQQSLNATATGVQWVVESYSLFLAALLLVGVHSVIATVAVVSF